MVSISYSSSQKTLDIKHKTCYNVYEKRKDTSQTRKAINMKKSTLQSLVNYLDGQTVTNLDEIKAELVAELGKDQAKKDATNAEYATIHEKVMKVLGANDGATAAELETETGVAKGKIVYGITRLWKDEIAKDTSGKVTVYRKA